MIVPPGEIHLRCKRGPVAGNDPPGTADEFPELLRAVVTLQICHVFKGGLQVYLVTPKALARFARLGKSTGCRLLQVAIELVYTEAQLPIFHYVERLDIQLLKRTVFQSAGSFVCHKGNGVDTVA